MIELYSPQYESLNTKERITIDMLQDGKNFLEKFEILPEFMLDTISVVYRYLRKVPKIPHNLYNFFISSYYINTRHPFSFPAHQTKEEYCNQFKIKVSTLEYCVEKIVSTLGYVKIMDDMNFPYFIDPKSDLSLNMIKKIVKARVKKDMMNFLINQQPINSQIISEELVTEIVLEYKAFPEELFRQLYEIVSELVEDGFKDYQEYVKLQQQYFI